MKIGFISFIDAVNRQEKLAASLRDMKKWMAKAFFVFSIISRLGARGWPKAILRAFCGYVLFIPASNMIWRIPNRFLRINDGVSHQKVDGYTENGNRRAGSFALS